MFFCEIIVGHVGYVYTACGVSMFRGLGGAVYVFSWQASALIWFRLVGGLARAKCVVLVIAVGSFLFATPIDR